VPTRLWLGGVISARRDGKLIWSLVQQIRAQALEAPIVLVTDGLSSYVNAWKRAFRNTVHSGKRGGARRVPWPCVVIGQVLKKYEKKRAIGVEARRLVAGTTEEFEALRVADQVLNTAYIERLTQRVPGHFSPALLRSGTPRPVSAAPGIDASGGNVSGRQRLQLLHPAPDPADSAAERFSSGGANARVPS
jgi:hypothetical protein